MEHQFLPSDFEGNYWNTKDCALARLSARLNPGKEVRAGGWFLGYRDENDRCIDTHDVGAIRLNGKLIEGGDRGLSSSSFDLIRRSILDGTFISATAELEELSH